MFPIYLLSTPVPEIFNRNIKNNWIFYACSAAAFLKLKLVFRNVEVQREVCSVGFTLYCSN